MQGRYRRGDSGFQLGAYADKDRGRNREAPEGELGAPREPEVARLKDGVILVEPLDGSRWEGER